MVLKINYVEYTGAILCFQADYFIGSPERFPQDGVWVCQVPQSVDGGLLEVGLQESPPACGHLGKWGKIAPAREEFGYATSCTCWERPPLKEITMFHYAMRRVSCLDRGWRNSSFTNWRDAIIVGVGTQSLLKYCTNGMVGWFFPPDISKCT